MKFAQQKIHPLRATDCKNANNVDHGQIMWLLKEPACWIHSKSIVDHRQEIMWLLKEPAFWIHSKSIVDHRQEIMWL